MLRQLQIHRQIIRDISASVLAPLPSLYQRLLHLASTRDQATGKYESDRLEGLYPGTAVQESLAQCHEELLERILETPLEWQEKDLHQCLDLLPGGFSSELENWHNSEFENMLLPEQAPEYLKQLFRSNLRVLLQVLREDCPRVRSGG
ncbi:MAG: hypothetical protein PVS2B2_02910 [Candidatus Acidiferrum sp.]